MPAIQDPARAHLVRRTKPYGGWVFRVPSRLQSDIKSLVFSDERFGGDSDAALRAAQAARDELFERLKAPLVIKAQSSTSNNESTLPGVLFILKKNNLRNKVFATWEANWVEGEGDARRQVRKRFTCSVHGFVKAWELAVTQRQVGAQVNFTPEQLAQATTVRDRLMNESIQNGWV